eukprot:1140841-Pelagomonas_calceolata.AAC.6
MGITRNKAGKQPLKSAAIKGCVGRTFAELFQLLNLGFACTGYLGYGHPPAASRGARCFLSPVNAHHRSTDTSLQPTFFAAVCAPASITASIAVSIAAALTNSLTATCAASLPCLLPAAHFLDHGPKQVLQFCANGWGQCLEVDREVR